MGYVGVGPPGVVVGLEPEDRSADQACYQWDAQVGTDVFGQSGPELGSA